MNYLLAFAASFIFVGLKAFQTLNVSQKQYILVLPTSMLMAICEVYVIATTAKNGFGLIALAIGLGAGLGCMASMYLHGKLTKTK